MDFVKTTVKILKPAAAGVVGYLAAKAINNIPTGTPNETIATHKYGKYLAPGIKIALAVFAPKLLGKKVPFVAEASIGVAMAGVSDLAALVLPSEFASKIGIAGRLNGGGLHGLLPRRTGNAIAGQSYTRIGCDTNKSETAMHA